GRSKQTLAEQNRSQTRAPTSRARRRLGGDDDARTKRFKSRAQIRVVPCEVFDESAGLGGATGAEEEVREVADCFKVAGPGFHGEAISLFGFGRVAPVGE